MPGIGTHLTNDFHRRSDPSEPSKALNIVLKLNSINGQYAVKISDELTKNTGDPHEVAYVSGTAAHADCRMVKRRFHMDESGHIEDA